MQTLWSMAGGGDKTRGEDGDNDEKKNGAGRGGESSSALVPAQMLRSKSKQQKSLVPQASHSGSLENA